MRLISVIVILLHADRACLVNVIRNEQRSIAQLIIYCWGYVQYNYSYNDDAFISGTEFPIVISSDDLIDGQNTFVFQAAGEDGNQHELRGSFDNMRTGKLEDSGKLSILPACA